MCVSLGQRHCKCVYVFMRVLEGLCVCVSVLMCVCTWANVPVDVCVCGSCTVLSSIPMCCLDWYPGAQHPGSRWRKWGGDCGTKEEALASVLDWMAIEHKMAVSKMPASVNKDMFTEVMAGLPLPASRAAQDAQLKAKDMGAEGQSSGRAIGRGRGKARGKGGPQGAHRKQKRQAVSPWMGSSSEDSDSSIVCKPTTMAMALTATVPQVAPPVASSSSSPPRAMFAKAQAPKANAAKVKAKPSPAPGSTEDMVRQAKAELRKPKKSM